jgi:hypothetical protein
VLGIIEEPSRSRILKNIIERGFLQKDGLNQIFTKNELAVIGPVPPD